MEQWHLEDVPHVLVQLKTDEDRGLSSEEAGKRLAEFGANTLKEAERKSPWVMFVKQFTDVMIVVLLVAAVISGVTGDLTDTVVILAIVLLNAILGFSQEYRAERAIAALKKLEIPSVVVLRDGHLKVISSSDLVPGDIIHIEAGKRIPADVRLSESANLRIDESALTGESVPVGKNTAFLAGENVPLADRKNMAFMGTTSTYGRGTAVVVSTGMKTELGRIAHLLQTAEEGKTPLQNRLAYLGKWLAGAALSICGVIFISGVLRGEPIQLMLLTAITLAVAAIPEGLPAVVAIVLALGAQRMLKRQALIRKLPAVETLGCVTAICSDKTGTLTQNKMSVELLYLVDRWIEVTGSGYIPEGEFFENGQVIKPEGDPLLSQLLKAVLLCNDAHLEERDSDSESEKWGILGDPTEGALVVAAAKAGFLKNELEHELLRVSEIPFDSVRKRMTTIHRQGKIYRAFTKGGVEEIIKLCTHIDGKCKKELTPNERERILKANDAMAQDGLRVLAVAHNVLDTVPEDIETVERELTFLGLIGMMDAPRPEAKEAVSVCNKAGITPIMITGDHRITGESIARSLGILTEGRKVYTGTELDAMLPEDFLVATKEASVYTRVSPEHKVKIVDALRKEGALVAMTGDGVNDAPAIKGADIGVAMGITGTDVTKEASDMVLLDDNFATIVAAVEEGRIIYDNIRKFTRYMLSTNSGELLTMFLAILFGLPLPLLPIQILWINLVTDGLPALALGVEPAEINVMSRPPRHPQESIFARGLGYHILWVGVLMAVGSLGIFIWDNMENPLPHAQTMVFYTLVMFQLFHVMAIRSEEDSLFTIGIMTNPHLVGAVLTSVILQLVIIYVPYLQGVFHTTSLTIVELIVCTGVASSLFCAVEIEKLLMRRKKLYI